ncbi:MAG: hypothetical protein N3B12_00965 [Armatimonadetes bacterium]|nr:hypothetical protein [Armatimonadota bacterium]
MGVRRLQERLISVDLRQILQRNRFWLGFFAVAFVCSILIVLVGLATSPAKKIDANNVISPWDWSAAPPPILSPNEVKVIGKPLYKAHDRLASRDRSGTNDIDGVRRTKNGG